MQQPCKDLGRASQAEVIAWAKALRQEPAGPAVAGMQGTKKGAGGGEVGSRRERGAGREN